MKIQFLSNPRFALDNRTIQKPHHQQNVRNSQLPLEEQKRDS